MATDTDASKSSTSTVDDAGRLEAGRTGTGAATGPVAVAVGGAAVRFGAGAAAEATGGAEGRADAAGAGAGADAGAAVGVDVDAARAVTVRVVGTGTALLDESAGGALAGASGAARARSSFRWTVRTGGMVISGGRSFGIGGAAWRNCGGYCC